MAGDCYEAAGRYIMDATLAGKGEGLILVHAEITGQGPIEGLRHGHAWVEDGEMVIDRSNGRDIRLPRLLYYALARLHSEFPPFEANMHRYDWDAASARMVEHEHWGPWDLETSTGL